MSIEDQISSENLKIVCTWLRKNGKVWIRNPDLGKPRKSPSFEIDAGRILAARLEIED